MTVKEAIDIADSMRENALTSEQKTRFLNILETEVQSDIFLISPPDLRRLVWELSAKATGILFPTSSTMVLPRETGIRKYDLLTISGLEDYASNNGTYTVLSVSEDGLTLRFAAGTFTPGTEAESAEATLYVDGSSVKLMVPPPYDDIYWTHLIAMIDLAHGDTDLYAASYAQASEVFTRYKAWVMRTFDPAR